MDFVCDSNTRSKYYYFLSFTALSLSTLYSVGDMKIYECGAIGEIEIVRKNRRILREPLPLPPYRAQIPHDLTWDGTQAAALENRKLTA
jgi:hypothetical protein